MKIPIYTALFFMLCIQAFAQQKFHEVKVGHIYYVSLPEYMTEAANLNEAATMQYQNTLKEAYVIVIEDSKHKLEGLGMKFTGPLDFYENFIKDFAKPDAKTTDPVNLKISGMKAVQAELTQNVDGTDIFYLVTVIESDGYFYKMLAWTLLENKDKLLDDYKKIAKSFKE